MSQELIPSSESPVSDADHRPLAIWKFGGTSVGGAKPIRRVASLAQRQYPRTDLVLVASAIRGVTDQLVAICENIANREEGRVGLALEDLLVEHKVVTDELFPAGHPFRESLDTDILRLCSELHDVARSTFDITDEIRARIVSFGERLSVRIVRAQLMQVGVMSEAVDATAFLETDDNFLEAKPDFGKTRVYAQRLLRPLIECRIVPVVTGFIAATRNNRITVLGRGGSDFTASILGLVLDADEVCIWTDVDGIYDIDPRYNPDAALLRELTQYQASRMARAGAKVLHPKTLDPLMGTKTVLVVKNTFRPDAEGTRVVPGSRD